MHPPKRGARPRPAEAILLAMGVCCLFMADVLWAQAGPEANNLSLGLALATVGGAFLLASALAMARSRAKARGRTDRAEASLRSSQDRFMLAMEATTDGVWDLDLTSPDAYFSPGFARQVGVDPSVLTPTAGEFWNRVHPEDLKGVRDAIDGHLHAGRAFDVAFRLRHSSGQDRWFRARGGCVRDGQGRPARMVGSTLDITDVMAAAQSATQFSSEALLAKQRAERQTQDLAARSAQLERATEQARAAIRAKSEFLRNVSHEVRTPLTAILGYCDFLLDGPTPEAQREESAQTIRRNAEHLLAIMNDVLEIADLDASGAGVAMAPCDPAAVASETIEALRPRAVAKKLALEFTHELDPGARIMTDARRLRQILLNLIGNAVKFTETGAVRVRLDHADGRLRASVEDTGVGIPREALDHLFLPFAQVDASLTRRFGGTGLGLAICKRLSEALGGDITVRSTLGEGSCFTLTIPWVNAISDRSDAHATTRPSPSPTPGQVLTSRRILLVEDSPDTQRLLSFFLRQAGASVEVADHGVAAVELVRQSLVGTAQGSRTPGFDLVLMDLQMPFKDGFEATREVRAMGYTGPILAVTAHAIASERDRCLSAGFDDFACKPIPRAALIELCSRWTGGAGSCGHRAA